MKLTVGRIVHYRLTAQDAETINRRRSDCASISERLSGGEWPPGAQAHVGNPEAEGTVLPMMIVRVWPDEGGPGIPGVNGQVILDGNDSLWKTSIHEGTAPGEWSWPPRE